MRIIKEGKLPPKEKKMKCENCGCPTGRLLGRMPHV